MTRKKQEKQEINTIKKKANKKFSRLRGMKDVLFDEYQYWDLIFDKIKELATAYDFKRIDTPILENLSMYEKTTGKTSDIVTKEMYSFVDKNGEKIALRPEATPGVVRAYIEHGMFNLPQPVKTCWVGPVFRHDRPQAGRYRQHSQFNLDIFGEECPVADFMLILVAYNLFKELQIDTQVQINSIGCEECRKEYIKKLVEFYKGRGKRSKMCNDCKKRLTKNPLRLLDCKEKACVEIREDAPQIVDYLCEDCKGHFIKVLEYLDEMEVPYNLNPYLVRGLDYYNRTVFEFTATDNNGSLSLGGGGRYDGLVEHMGGRPTFACGFGLGIERTVMKIKENNLLINNNDLVFVAQLGEQAKRKSFVLFEDLRKDGFKVRQAFTKDSLKDQLEEANRINSRFGLIIGQKEVVENTVLFRDMESGNQEEIDFGKIKNELTKRLKNN